MRVDSETQLRKPAENPHQTLTLFQYFANMIHRRPFPFQKTLNLADSSQIFTGFGLVQKVMAKLGITVQQDRQFSSSYLASQGGVGIHVGAR